VSVRPSVGPAVGPSVGPLRVFFIGQKWAETLKNEIRNDEAGRDYTSHDLFRVYELVYPQDPVGKIGKGQGGSGAQGVRVYIFRNKVLLLALFSV
jgi:hypothetical protein